MIGAVALQAFVATCPSRPLRDTFFRVVALRHHADPLGRRRPINRQRFNLKNAARILYVGQDQITCLYEVDAFGFPVTSTAVIPFQLQLSAVLDLSDPAIQRALAITHADIVMNFRPVQRTTDMHQLGETLAASGLVDGLKYESVARPGTFCLAIFEANVVALGSIVAVNDPQNGLVVRM